MKQILFLFFLFPLALFGQFPFGGASIGTGDGGQDSVVYKKMLNTSENYKGDSIYYKITYSKNGDEMNVRTQPFTDVDSLMKQVLFNAYTDASRQYKNAILVWEAQERGYELRLRQAERQYLQFTGQRIKNEVEKNFDFADLIGDWLLNGKPIKLDAKLEIDKKPIKLLSDQQFTVEIDKERQVFNRIKKDRWVSKGEKYRLERPKPTEKKKNK